MDWGDPNTDRIVAFLEGIGIAVAPGAVEAGFLPGIAIRDGGLIVDAGRGFHPGDLLHEAGHIAVMAPENRPALSEVADEPADEMAAIAWSYAAALAIGIDPRILFHGEGYRGGGAALAAAFEGGATPGAPMLQLYGMSAEPHMAERLGLAPYPAMRHWLRQAGSSPPE